MSAIIGRWVACQSDGTGATVVCAVAPRVSGLIGALGLVFLEF